ncbi:MAG: Lrp/AsnC family transcriptional regulator [Deltaproteobacteria bacterium]|nr:Lrp/AsnC family transcriptional regulator [Deltaproteobacteria bacterium]
MKSGKHPDATDLALCVALQEDAKMSLQRLGERVGLSAQSVLERVRKLEAAGVIRGYHADVDARAVGLDVTAFIGVGIDTTRHLDAVEQALGVAAEVLECHHVTGAHTLMVKIKTRNTATLELLIREIRGMPGVQRTETMIVLSTHKESSTLHLPDVTPRTGRRAKESR